MDLKDGAVLTELKVIARTEQRGLQLAQHGRGELEGLAQVVGVESLLHEEGLLPDDRHVLIQNAVLIIIHHHLRCLFFVKNVVNFVGTAFSTLLKNSSSGSFNRI